MPLRPRQHTPNTVKIARHMSAWRLGHDHIPADVLRFVIPLPCGLIFSVVSPNGGLAVPARTGWWVIQAETGCLYAVPDDQFRAKYTTFH